MIHGNVIYDRLYRVDTLLDWIVTILPFAGSLYLAVKPPKRVRWWAIICFGLAVSILTFLQLHGSHKSHERELLETTARLDQANAKLGETSQNLAKLSALLDQYVNTHNADEAKMLRDAVRKALQQAQQTAIPQPPSNVTAVPN